VRAERLLKLAAHLRGLKPSEFDFMSPVSRPAGNGCGTLGCAIGWAPAVFPELCRWRKSGYGKALLETTLLGRAGQHDYVEVAVELFGIDEREATRLFTPYAARQWVANDVEPLGNHATPQEVAESIELFVAWKSRAEVGK